MTSVNRALTAQNPNPNPFLTELKILTEGRVINRFFIVKEGVLTRTNLFDFLWKKLEGLFSSQDLTNSCLVEYKALQFLTRGKGLVSSPDDVERVKTLVARLGLSPGNKQDHMQLQNLADAICNWANLTIPTVGRSQVVADDLIADFFEKHKEDLIVFPLEILNTSEFFDRTLAPTPLDVKQVQESMQTNPEENHEPTEGPKLSPLANTAFTLLPSKQEPAEINLFQERAELSTEQTKKQEMEALPSKVATQIVTRKDTPRKAKELKANDLIDSRWEGVAKIAIIGVSVIGLSAYVFSLLQTQLVGGVTNLKVGEWVTTVIGNGQENEPVNWFDAGFTPNRQELMEKAKNLVQEAEKSSNSFEWSHAGFIYEQIEDLGQAVFCHSEAAKRANPHSMEALERLNNKTVIKDIEQIRRDFNQLTDKELEERNKKIEASVEKAENLVEEAKKSGDSFEWSKAAFIYEEIKDWGQAVFCHSEAAKRADPYSMRAIERLQNKTAINDIAAIRNDFNQAYDKKIKRLIEIAGQSNSPYHAYYLWEVGHAYNAIKDYNNAVLWFRKGVERGHQFSMDMIEQINKHTEIPDIEAIRSAFKEAQSAFNQANQGILGEVAKQVDALIKKISPF